MNNENLKPYKKGDERAIQNGKKGAMNSANSRKQKKMFKEIAKSLLNHDIPDKDKIELLSKYNDLEPDEICYRTLIIMKQLEKAINGDLRSCEFIMETAGEKPKEDEDIEVKLPYFHIEIVDNDEVKEEWDRLEEEENSIY